MKDDLLKEEFLPYWQENEEDIKEMSKRDLAEDMFGYGVYIAMKRFMESMKKEGK